MERKYEKEVVDAFASWCRANAGAGPTIFDAMGFFVETQRLDSSFHRYRDRLGNWADFVALLAKRDIVKKDGLD